MQNAMIEEITSQGKQRCPYSLTVRKSGKDLKAFCKGLLKDLQTQLSLKKQNELIKWLKGMQFI